MSREYVIGMACTHDDRFKERLHVWLRNDQNFHIWRRFETEANKIWDSGRRHYSGRTIGEFLRHETALGDTDSHYKINDHIWPELTRLYLILYPDRSGFFTLHEGKRHAA